MRRKTDGLNHPVPRRDYYYPMGPRDFLRTFGGLRIATVIDRSKYMPHQGKRERDRRVRQGLAIKAPSMREKILSKLGG